ncbi:MAG TPA: peptide chain release factor N(5)-glutamine methyltransferase [Verrucomicrobiae bacterium]|nr:peptide chain release factor N(5)-glutamine methyltransferase [Verrucomicrobiae bacterium]
MLLDPAKKTGSSESPLNPAEASRPKTLSELLDWGKKELEPLGPEEACASAEFLLAEITGLPRSGLYLGRTAVLEQDLCHKYESLVLARKDRNPLAYLTGTACFWEEKLKVNAFCLIPRPETECMLESFIRVSGFEKRSAFSFLDLGSGSGAIGVALLRHFEKARAVFSDISRGALQTARENAASYGLTERGSFLCADLLEAFFPDACFDVIFSNPPYFSYDDWARVEPEILKEPRAALDGGPDGLFFYRRIAAQAARLLKADGRVLVEMGEGQAKDVAGIFQEAGFPCVEIFKDDLNLERVLMAHKKTMDKAHG